MISREVNARPAILKASARVGVGTADGIARCILPFDLYEDFTTEYEERKTAAMPTLLPPASCLLPPASCLLLPAFRRLPPASNGLRRRNALSRSDRLLSLEW